MAQKTNKTLELRIKTTSDGDAVLDKITSKTDKLGAKVTNLTSVYTINKKGVEEWTHSVKIAADSLKKLNTLKTQLALSGVGSFTTGATTQAPLAESVAAYKAYKRERETISKALLANVRKELKEEEAAEKERVKQGISLRKQQAQQYRDILSAKNTRQANVEAENQRLLAANKRTIALQKAIIAKGANDIIVVRLKAAEKARLIEEKLQKDLADISKRSAEGSLKNRVAAQTKVFSKFRRESLEIAKNLQKVEVEEAKVVKLNKDILAAKRKVRAEQDRVNRSIARGSREQVHWAVKIAEGIGLYRVFNAVVNTTVAAISAVPRIGIELQTTKAVLESTLGSGAKVAAVFSGLNQEAQRTGIDIGTLRENFRNLNASMGLAGESTQTVWDLFTNLNTVTTALHLPADKVKLTFLAISQIFNKTKVQSEELVKQLGNLLPGAFARFQKANADLFPSTQDLAKSMKAGLVFAHDTMVKFVRQMAIDFKAGFAIAQSGLQAAIGRYKTSLIHLGETVFAQTKDSMTAVLSVVTDLVNGLNRILKGTDAISVSIKEVGKVGLALLVGGITQAVLQSKLLRVIWGNIVDLIALARKQLGPILFIAGLLEIIKQNEKYANVLGQIAKIQHTIAKETKLANATAAERLKINLQDDPSVVAAKERLRLVKKFIRLTKLKAKIEKDLFFFTFSSTKYKLVSGQLALSLAKKQLKIAKDNAKTAQENATAEEKARAAEQRRSATLKKLNSLVKEYSDAQYAASKNIKDSLVTLKEQYDNNLLTVEDYYKEKQRLQLKDLDTQIETAKTQLKILQSSDTVDTAALRKQLKIIDSLKSSRRNLAISLENEKKKALETANLETAKILANLRGTEQDHYNLELLQLKKSRDEQLNLVKGNQEARAVIEQNFQNKLLDLNSKRFNAVKSNLAAINQVETQAAQQRVQTEINAAKSIVKAQNEIAVAKKASSVGQVTSLSQLEQLAILALAKEGIFRQNNTLTFDSSVQTKVAELAKKLPAFATGGSFTVGGNGAVDSSLVAFRATKGEKVIVQTPNQQVTTPTNDTNIHINNLSLPNVSNYQEFISELKQQLRVNPNLLQTTGTLAG